LIVKLSANYQVDSGQPPKTSCHDTCRNLGSEIYSQLCQPLPLKWRVTIRGASRVGTLVAFVIDEDRDVIVGAEMAERNLFTMHSVIIRWQVKPFMVGGGPRFNRSHQLTFKQQGEFYVKN
jgi:hypothetical protein